ncbi:MAG: hypothetical protein GEV11_16690 [Streptosporangiales bacterium]|nr:hypothetical protein [Streptosporangiales bacterium]
MTGTRLTTRGALVLLLLGYLAGYAAALLLSSSRPLGVAFLAVSVAVALFTRRADLLSLVVCPPLLFFAAVLLGTWLSTLGSDNLTLAVGLGVFTRLADTAPWLLTGTLATVLICWVRGLPDNLRELQDEMVPGARRSRR